MALLLVCPAATLLAQAPNVLTWRYDNTHQGQNTQETILTPANVNTNTFGKLFSHAVDGNIYAQPLYVSNLSINGTTHNVIFVATEHDSVYAFDADTNGGANSTSLWQASLISTAHGAASGATTVPYTDVQGGVGDIHPEIGITGTPVIDAATQTLFVVAKSKENGNYVQRLHALNLLNGSERSGSPVALSASVPGNGNASSNGTLDFSSLWQNNRAALGLFNGHVYITFASHGDDGPWHGWILVYDEATLKQTAATSTSPNGDGDGIWSSGAGLPIDTVSADGRGFIVTGNGDLTSYPPLSNSADFGESVLRYDLSNGGFAVADAFTAFNQSTLTASDLDLGAGGILMLPDQGGTYPHELVIVGKQARILVLDRDKLNGYAGPDAGKNTNAVQDITNALGGGLWSTPAYWNGNVYMWASGDALKMFPLSNGVLASQATEQSSSTSGFPGASPVISSNGTQDGIVWALRTDQYSSNGSAVLYAFNATDVAQEYYTSNQNPNRDDTGQAMKFQVPVVTNGKVYVGAGAEVGVYGLLNREQQTPAPVISPSGGTYGAAQQITMTDSASGAAIYYTTDGSTPTTSSTKYVAGGFRLSTNATVRAIASASGDLQSTVASATYGFDTQLPTPQFDPAPGSYSSAQSVTITDTNANAAIYYTTDGSTPTTSSTRYSKAIPVSSSTVISAIAVASGLTNSDLASGSYVVQLPGTTINYSTGFSSVAGLTLNGSATNVDDSRLQLTTGIANQTGSVFYETPTNIQAFTTDFAFQLSNAVADGFTFTIQNGGPTALGGGGDGLGYTTLAKSVAVKFDFYNNAGEGADSTGLYVDGATPTVPAVDMTSSGVVLNSGDTIDAHMTYDGANLVMTLTDIVVNKVFTHTFPVDIPGTVGGNTAYIGFTGASGEGTASQKILSWTLSSTGTTTTQTAAPTFSPGAGTYSSAQSVTLSDAGATIYYTTDGSTPTTSSARYGTAIPVTGNTTVRAIAVASGKTQSAVASATYVIQSSAPSTINFAGGFASATGMQMNGSATLNAGSLELTNVGGYEAGSAFWKTPVNIQAFTTNFTFQLTSAVADGFTFTVQNAGITALGNLGGGLGYGINPNGGTGGGIGKSVAVKFDLYSDSGEPANSTGVFTDGAAPTNPSVALTSSGISLASGDTISAQLIYNGTTLTLHLTDTVTGDTFSQSFTINIPSTVGANTAYVGFTGGTGGSSAIQNIKAWTFSSGTTQTAADPVFSPLPGTYTTAQTVKLTSATAGTTIYYTVDGSTPTHSSPVYGAGIVVNGVSLTIRAFASATGYQDSPIVVGTYQIKASAAAAATPIFSPSGGRLFYPSLTVSISDTTAGSVVYYTTDGTTPTTSSTRYTNAFSIDASTSFKAIAVAPGLANSSIATATYTREAAPYAATTPTFIPASGTTFTAPLLVSMTDLTSGSVLYYTTDGSTPTTSSTRYTGPFNIDASTSFKGIAVAPGLANSGVATASYTLKGAAAAAATPTISPSSGRLFYPALTVTMSDTTADSVLYYTTDGSTPTTSSTRYTGAFSIDASTSFKAIAVAPGLAVSSIATASYTREAAPYAATTPAFIPANGTTFSSSLKVSMTDLTSGSVLYYTTDGSTPTTSSTRYTGPFNIDASVTLKGIAAASGLANSGVATASYKLAAINYGGGFGSTAGLTLNGSTTSAGGSLELTNGSLNQTGSVFYNTPTNIQTFATDFSFQFVNAHADGITFTVQNVGPTAIGGPGGGLGYGPDPTAKVGASIGKSVAVKFDFYNNDGEGMDSTGVYLDGASPTVPAVDMTSSGVVLASGDTMAAHITYDGTNLVLTVTDTVTQKVFTHSFAVNIPSTIGSDVGYVGFTGSTGGETAVQKILSWTLAP